MGLIRSAHSADTMTLFKMTKDVYGEFMAKYGIEVNNDDLMETVRSFIDTNGVIVLERDGEIKGMAAFVLSVHPVNRNLKIMQEILWCLNSDKKTDALLLLRAFMNKAKELGADMVVLANLSEMNEERLRKVYQHMGFSFMESHYSRRT